MGREDLVLIGPPKVGRRPTKTFWDKANQRYVRECRICTKILPIDAFIPMTTEKRFGKGYYCRPCGKEKSKQNHAAKRYGLKRFGLTKADFDAMLASQGGQCGICQRPFPATPQVDHDHRTGATRSLLCSACNCILGLAKDDVATLEACITYLRKHQCSAQENGTNAFRGS